MADTKKWDVFMESFVCVELPADVDPDAQPEVIAAAAVALYMERLRTGQCEFTWEAFHE